MTNRIVNNLIGSIDGLYKNRNAGHTHYSGIYRNGKPYYLGSNSLRNTYNGSCICFSTHAEMDVLYKMLKVEERTTI